MEIQIPGGAGGGPGVLSLLESFDLVTKLQSRGPTHHGRVMLYL